MDRNQGTGRNGLDWDLVRLEIEMGIGGTGLDWGLVRLDIEPGKVVRQQQKHTCPHQFGAADATEAGASGASADRSYCFRFPYSRNSVSNLFRSKPKCNLVCASANKLMESIHKNH